jgi:hypothetical protein
MKLPEIDVEYIDEIHLGKHEHVTVVLPDGRRVTVYADHIRVQTCKQVLDHVDGKKIWQSKDEPKQVHYPYEGGCYRCPGDGYV